MDNLNFFSFLKQRAILSFIVLVAGWLFFYWPLLSSIIKADQRLWVSLTTVAIVVAVFYLVFERRRLLSRTVFISSQIGLACLFLLAGLFVLSSILDATWAMQYIVLLMLPFMVMTSFGFSVFLILLLPLLLLLFIVPLHSNAFENKSITLILAIVIYAVYMRYLKIYKPSMSILPANPIWSLEDSRWLMPTGVALCLLMASPWLADNIRSFYPAQIHKIVLRPPLATDGWKGPYIENNLTWLPYFPNASATIQVNYYADTSTNQDRVYLFTAYYDPNRSFEDILEPNNSVYNKTFWKPSSQITSHSVDLGKKGSLDVYEEVLQAGAFTRLVWYWYYVAGVSTTDYGLAKWIDRVRIVSKYSEGSGVIVLSTSVVTATPDEARARLQAFLEEMNNALVVLRRPDIVLVKP